MPGERGFDVFDRDGLVVEPGAALGRFGADFGVLDGPDEVVPGGCLWSVLGWVESSRRERGRREKEGEDRPLGGPVGDVVRAEGLCDVGERVGAPDDEHARVRAVRRERGQRVADAVFVVCPAGHRGRQRNDGGWSVGEGAPGGVDGEVERGGEGRGGVDGFGGAVCLFFLLCCGLGDDVPDGHVRPRPKHLPTSPSGRIRRTGVGRETYGGETRRARRAVRAEARAELLRVRLGVADEVDGVGERRVVFAAHGRA